MLIVRWFGWQDGPLVPIYPGAEPLPEVPLVGITTGDQAVAHVMGKLLLAWAAAACVHAH